MSCGSCGHASWLFLPTEAEGFAGLGGDDNQRARLWRGGTEEEFLLGNSRVLSVLPLLTIALLPHLLPAPGELSHSHSCEVGTGDRLPPVCLLPGEGRGGSRQFTEGPLRTEV